VETIEIHERIPVKGSYDVIVAGGGVAGVAAAVSAKRAGKNVLLLEKSISLGGLATLGLINLFVPMCNGRGTQIIKGMAEEFLRLSIKYGYDTIPEEWKNGEPGEGAKTRYVTRFSAPIFALALTELVYEEGIDLLFDTVVSRPVMEGNHCKGLIVENKSGREFYAGKVIIDTTGDADVLYRAGVPTVQGKNYFTYMTMGASIESCKKVVETGDIGKLTSYYSGGRATLYGEYHPENMKLYEGTTVAEVTEFVVKNQLEALNKIKNTDRKSRDILTLPGMPQFRTTRHIDGDYTLTTNDQYKHFEDSIGAICDFDQRDYLYEVPFRTLTRRGFDNLITAGRSASATGYAWDVLRVIPPAIITGQAAGLAASYAIDEQKPIYDIDIKNLQKQLEQANVMIHFDDALIPKEPRKDIPAFEMDHI